MDAATDPAVHTLVVMSAAQVGKTEILNNLIGYHIDRDPGPILVLQPTLDMAQAWSKDRLAPMIRDSPCLTMKVKDPKSRDSDNTVLHKVFAGGHVTIAGANSAASLASRPIRIVVCDEVDRYPASAGTEGDPVSLAAKRSTTFWNRKLVLVSTPTVKGGRIDRAWDQSDQRHFYVPCGRCGKRQIMAWKGVIWSQNKNGEHAPETARYKCEQCAAEWTDGERLAAIMLGKWRPSRPFTGVAGFHLNAFVSPWVRLSEIVADFLESKDFPEKKRVFVNTVLGETWEDPAEKIDDGSLLSRRERYGPELPVGAAVLVAGVDVQNDRLEVEFLGIGSNEENWQIDYRVIPGDPATGVVWRQLDDLLLKRWPREDGAVLSLAAACVDTGGHHTQSAYAFCRERYGRRVWAIKGSSDSKRQIWPRRPTKKNKGGVPLFIVGVDAAKDLVYGRLRIDKPGPGYCHFPDERELEYFEQLTAERIVTKHSRGFAVRRWEKDRGRRNEALDCRVYAVCAFTGLVSMGLNLEREVERLAATATKTPGPPVPGPAHRRVRSSGVKL